MRRVEAVAVFVVMILGMCISGCAGEPTPFVLGDEVPAPHGCIDYRKRGGEC